MRSRDGQMGLHGGVDVAAFAVAGWWGMEGMAGRTGQVCRRIDCS